MRVKEIENAIHMIFTGDKYDNIQRKAFNNINEVDNIKLHQEKVYEILEIRKFGKFLIRAFDYK